MKAAVGNANSALLNRLKAKLAGGPRIKIFSNRGTAFGRERLAISFGLKEFPQAAFGFSREQRAHLGNIVCIKHV